MPDNNIEWGQGGVNNNNDWGKAKANSTNNFGAVYDSSPSGDTNIAGGQPVVSITYSASAFCADASDPTPTVQNNAGAGTFSSTAGLVFISTSTGEVDIDASTVGSYLITYTDTDAATATFNLSINALPTVTVSVSAGTICNGESTILTASGASTYVWNDGNTDNPRTVSPITTTTFTATGTDSNGCVSSGATQITVNALPTVEISGTLTYCAGSTTTLTATAGLSSYLWSTGATTQAINVTAGSYTVTGTDSNGCSATSAASAVTELPLDTATVSYSSSAYCQMPTGATAIDGYYPLYSTASAANAVSSDGTNHTHVLSGVTYYMPNAGVIAYHGTYSLTTPAPTITGETGTFSESTGNLTIDSSTGVINVNNSTAGTYTVVYTTNGTCPNTVNNTVTINALDGATFGYSASSLAQTGTASLTTTPTTSGGVFSAYPSGLSINSSTGEIDLAASTIQSYKIFYVTSAGCPNSSTFDLAVTASYLPFQMQFDVSGGKTISLNSVYGSSFYIDWGDGNTETNTGGINRTITHTYASGLTNKTISIGSSSDSGPLEKLRFTTSGSDLLDIPQWGSTQFTGLQNMFKGCNNTNFQISATDAPNILSGASMSEVFYNADYFNTDISNWDVSNVTGGLLRVFGTADSFNQNLSSWDIQSINLYLFFWATSMSTENYTDTIVGWAVTVYKNSGKYNVSMGAQYSRVFDNSRTSDNASGQTYAAKYGSDWTATGWTDAGDARDYLTGATANWTISGDSRIN